MISSRLRKADRNRQVISMNDEKKTTEKITGQKPGDVVIRRKRKEREKLRAVPNIPAFARFMGDLAMHTPLVPIIIALVVLLFVFATALYFVENGSTGENAIDTWGDALYWCISSAQTMGASDPLLYTTAGKVVGSIWAVLSTIMFFGAIIAAMTAYFMIPRRRPSKQIVSTIQYNLERIDDLSVAELETLKQSMNAVISSQIDNLKAQDIANKKAWEELGKIKPPPKE